MALYEKLADIVVKYRPDTWTLVGFTMPDKILEFMKANFPQKQKLIMRLTDVCSENIGDLGVRNKQGELMVRSKVKLNARKFITECMIGPIAIYRSFAYDSQKMGSKMLVDIANSGLIAEELRTVNCSGDNFFVPVQRILLNASERKRRDIFISVYDKVLPLLSPGGQMSVRSWIIGIDSGVSVKMLADDYDREIAKRLLRDPARLLDIFNYSGYESLFYTIFHFTIRDTRPRMKKGLRVLISELQNELGYDLRGSKNVRDTFFRYATSGGGIEGFHYELRGSPCADICKYWLSIIPKRDQEKVFNATILRKIVTFTMELDVIAKRNFAKASASKYGTNRTLDSYIRTIDGIEFCYYYVHECLKRNVKFTPATLGRIGHKFCKSNDKAKYTSMPMRFMRYKKLPDAIDWRKYRLDFIGRFDRLMVDLGRIPDKDDCAYPYYMAQQKGRVA